MTVPSGAIEIRGAREHNLQGVDLDIPRGKLVLFTGVSGSGKTSLAFDTLFAEGQRRYIESLGVYARQFLGRLERPRVESIRGLSPTIAIEQQRSAPNPRSTVGTVTEIHDHLRLLWARIGRQRCPACGREITAESAAQISASISRLPEGTRFLLLAPLVGGERGNHAGALDRARREGYARVRIDGALHELTAVPPLDGRRRHEIELVVDRLIARPGAEARIHGSVETALEAGGGELLLLLPDTGELVRHCEKLACPDCRLDFEPLTPASFSFNSLQGMCPACHGTGRVRALDEELLLPDRTLSLHQGAIEPWAEACQQREGAVYRWVAGAARTLGLDLDTPWEELPDEGRRAFLDGAGELEGLLVALTREADSLEAYTERTPCPDCGGARLHRASRAVELAGRSLPEIAALSVREAGEWFAALAPSGEAARIAAEPLREIRARLALLRELGLSYLALDRPAASLSGGEAQRIRLAGQLGSQLSGVIYVLDEPSIGLHPRDTEQLVALLRRLRDLGNTVAVVEHDPAAIRAADHVFDFGPGAGARGGRIVFSGTPQFLEQADCLTGEYLSGRRRVAPSRRPRGASRKQLVVRGAACNNLAGIDVAIPLERFVAVSGVSGAGKSSLVGDLLVPALRAVLHGARSRPGPHRAIEGIKHLERIVPIDQRPIGRSPRSNPATYTGIYAEIRTLFAEQKESRIHGFDAGRFSFNRKGGRCEACQGQGLVRIEMHFLPDVYTVCELCGGRRFNPPTLRVRYRGHDIAEVLDLSAAAALELFARQPRIAARLQSLVDVGLDYLALGQPANTLSGGEAQRIKLARELSRRQGGPALYVLDEPTTGLHFDDVARLLAVLQALVDAGHSVLVVEHDLEVIAQADHVIDLGPEGGAGGGRVVAAGPPDEIAACAQSYTGRFLARLL